jgi:hypothetical protein
MSHLAPTDVQRGPGPRAQHEDPAGLLVSNPGIANVNGCVSYVHVAVPTKYAS